MKREHFSHLLNSFWGILIAWVQNYLVGAWQQATARGTNAFSRFASYSAAKVRTKFDYFCFGPNSLARGRDCANELFPAFDVRLEMLCTRFRSRLLSVQRALLIDCVSEDDCTRLFVHHCDACSVVGMNVAHEHDLRPPGLLVYGRA